MLQIHQAKIAKEKMFERLKKELEKDLKKTTAKIPIKDSLHLPVDIPNDAQKFYEELEMPFFHSLTKEQITKLAPLQLQFWKDNS